MSAGSSAAGVSREKEKPRCRIDACSRATLTLQIDFAVLKHPQGNAVRCVRLAESGQIGWTGGDLGLGDIVFTSLLSVLRSPCDGMTVVI